VVDDRIWKQLAVHCPKFQRSRQQVVRDLMYTFVEKCAQGKQLKLTRSPVENPRLQLPEGHGLQETDQPGMFRLVKINPFTGIISEIVREPQPLEEGAATYDAPPGADF
jgi:hypothetical protein